MDEIQDTAVNESVDTSQDVTDSPAVEAVDTVDEQTEQSDVQEVQEQPKPRNNAPSRIKQLLGEKKQLEAERDQFAEMLQQQAQVQVPDNLTEDQYRALTADASYAALEVQNLKRQLAYKDFANEVDIVEKEYPELNPESDNYNEDLAKALSTAYEEGYMVKDNNGRFVSTKKSLKDFTSQMIKAYRTAEVKGATKTQEALAKQASEAVVTSQNNSSSETTDFKDLSIEEMEKKLGVVRL